MGSLSAMSSINRVIDRHGDEIIQTMLDCAPPSIQPMLKTVALENNVHSITTHWVFHNGDTLPGPSYHIDYLAEEYPGCEIAC